MLVLALLSYVVIMLASILVEIRFPRFSTFLSWLGFMALAFAIFSLILEITK